MNTYEITDVFKKLQAGDEGAFNEFYDRTIKYVLYTIEKTGVPKADIEDVAQEVYIRVFNSNANVKPEAALSWIKTVAFNKAVDHVRKSGKETLVYEDEGEAVFEESTLIAPMELPEDVMDNKESKRLIGEIVNKLPEKQLLIFRSYYFNEMKTKDISNSLGIPEGTVKAYLSRSREFVQSEVLAFTKKHGVKIASIAPAPLFGLIFTEEANACAVGSAVAGSILKGVFAKTAGAKIGAGVTAKVVTTGITKALVTKVAIAVIGVAAIGGGTVAIVNNMNAQKSAEEQQLEASRAEEASRLEKEEEEKRQSEEASKAEELKKQEETLLAEAKTKSEEETKKKLEEQQKQVSTAENGGAVKPHEETPANTPPNNGPTPPPGARSNIRANIPDWSWWQAEHPSEVSAWIEKYQQTHYHMDGEIKVLENPTWAEQNQAAARGEMGVAEEKYYWY